MKIHLMDILYTGGMLFLAFYGSIIITKFLSKMNKEQDSEESQEK